MPEEKKTEDKKSTPKKTSAATQKKSTTVTKTKKEVTKKPKVKVKKSPEKPKAEITEESKEEKKEVKDEKEKEPKKKKMEEEIEETKEEEEEGEEAEEEKAEEEEEIEIVEEEEKYQVRIKPKLSDEQKRSLKIRHTIKKRTPEFRRQEWFRYKKLGTAWRKPRGLHSKMRKHKGYRPDVVSIGYGSPSKSRFLHPSGFKEVMVYNVKDLEKIDPESQAARVGHSVGTRKRIVIEEKAEEKGIRVLNPRRL
jgi:large subunit ribosomal protein L32e